MTISGWVGVIIEKIIAGYLDRLGTNIVAVNLAATLPRSRQSPGAWTSRPTTSCSAGYRCCPASIVRCPSAPPSGL